jgi:hypothetical protein
MRTLTPDLLRFGRLRSVMGCAGERLCLAQPFGSRQQALGAVLKQPQAAHPVFAAAGAEEEQSAAVGGKRESMGQAKGKVLSASQLLGKSISG